MRGCFASTLINLIGAFLVVMAVALLGSTVFTQLPWRVTSQEAADTIRSFDVLSKLDEIEFLPDIQTYIRIEVVSELTPTIALTNSVLLAVMTATFCAIIFIGLLFIIVYGGYNLYTQGMGNIDSFIEMTLGAIIVSLIAVFLGPLSIWFTLLLQAGSPLYYVLWVAVGLPALLVGYSGIYYGTIVARWLGKQIIAMFSFANIFSNQNTQIGVGLLILTGLAFFLFFLAQIDLPIDLPGFFRRNNETSQSTTPPDNCRYIDYEAVIEGELTTGQEDTYCFTGQSGGSIAIRLIEPQRGTSFTLYPSLTLYNPAGRVLQKDNVEGGVAYAQILQNLNQTGTYWIRVAGSPTGGSGGYFLRVERGPKAGMGDVNRDCQVDDTDRQMIIDSIGTSGNPDLDLDLNGKVESRDVALFDHQGNMQCR